MCNTDMQIDETGYDNDNHSNNDGINHDTGTAGPVG